MSILSLGGIDFGIDDLPEEIPLGGTQQLAIRQFPGGGLDVQPLGAFDDPIQWEGTLIYGDALGRALALDELRIGGKAVTLIVGRINKQVIVSKFVYKYQNDSNIPYTIELQPLTTYDSDVTVNGLPDATVATIESVGTTTATVTATPAPSPQRTYTITSGDTLWGIAAYFYGDGSQWPRIADANTSVIHDPNSIYPGQTIIIP